MRVRTSRPSGIGFRPANALGTGLVGHRSTFGGGLLSATSGSVPPLAKFRRLTTEGSRRNFRPGQADVAWSTAAQLPLPTALALQGWYEPLAFGIGHLAVRGSVRFNAALYYSTTTSRSEGGGGPTLSLIRRLR